MIDGPYDVRCPICTRHEMDVVNDGNGFKLQCQKCGHIDPVARLLNKLEDGRELANLRVGETG